jgi:hemolysin activation/secretion protein
MSPVYLRSAVLMVTAASLFPRVAVAQTTLDRVDPARIEQSVSREKSSKPADAARVALSQPVARTGSPITVGAITLAGLEALHASDFADIFGLYTGRTLSPGALAGLVDAVTQRMRMRGYVFATAYIPPQPLAAGILRIAVDEGHVGSVRLVGQQNKAVAAALAPLVGKGPIRYADLERRLLIAGDIDGIWVRRSRIVREDNANVLEVSVGVDSVKASLGIDNSGSRPIGPVQADLTVTVSQILADDDSVTFTEVMTPGDPSEFGYLRLRYAKRVSHTGTEVSASGSFARTRPGAYLLPRDIEGTSWSGRLDVLQPLLRRRATSLWLSGSFGLRDVRQDRRDMLARRDRLTVARVGINGFTAFAGGRLRASAVVSQGLDLFAATETGDSLASRRDADGTFTAIGLSGDWTRAITEYLTTRIAISTQFADQPLLVSEEVGLGGGDFLRAYDYSERSGDQGTMASWEMRWALGSRIGPLQRPVLYGFLDGGRVTNLRDGFGGGSLFSTGGGLRSGVSKLFDADVSMAVPLSGPRYDSGSDDPVLNFRLSRRF